MQEHWLYNFEIPMVDQYISGSYFKIKCSDDDNPIGHAMKPRGEGGVLTIWSEQMDQFITPLPDGSNRVIAIKVGGDHPVFIINTYMPTQGSAHSYSEVADEVAELINKYNIEGYVVWAGDLNASKTRNSSTNDKHFKQLCDELCLDTVDNCPDKPTYHHFAYNIKSRIDHILAPPDSVGLISKTWVDERNPINTSTHDPVLAILDLPAVDRNSSISGMEEEALPKPNWRKVDLPAYREATKLKLDSLIHAGGLDLPPESLVERLYDILLQSATECSPSRKKGKKRTSKYPWAQELKPYIKAVKLLFYEWKTQGKPSEAPISGKLKAAKKAFRSIQRQLAAEHRNSVLKEISEASTDNKILFYKLVQRQRGGVKQITKSIDFGEEAVSQHEGWAQYFEKLATAEDLPHFDNDHAERMKSKLHLISLQGDTRKDPEPVSEGQIVKHIKALKNNKAADAYGLTAEHVKLASPEVVTILTVLTNSIFKSKKLPDQFKIGAIVPALKKGKPPKNPDSYRRITIASNIGKIVEKEIMTRTKPLTNAVQDPLQYGFTEGSSPSLCALVLSEAIAEAKDRKTPLFLSFLDSSKAFDMVDHTCLLNALYDSGVREHLWYLYQDMYTQVTAKVRLCGKLSRAINEGRGIRQGGETSTEAFKAKDNPFLKKVREHPASFRIGATPVGIPTVADDNCMLAETHTGAQTQLLVAEHNAKLNRYIFSTTKSKVILVNGHDSAKLALSFNDKEIEYSGTETHLGLIRTADGKAKQAVKARIQIGRRTANALMGAGLYGVNGVSPCISKILITTYVNPAVLYGLESLLLEEADLAELDIAHRCLLRHIQGLPRSTAGTAIYLLLGELPMRALLHRNILNLFVTILHKKGSAECDIIMRQLAMKDSTSSSWTTQLRAILHKYQLPSALQIAGHLPTKSSWKRTVKLAIDNFWEASLKQEARDKSSLKYLNINNCKIGKAHLVWRCGPDPMQATMAATKAVMLAGRYPLTGTRCAGRQALPACQLCESEKEDLQHFLIRCTVLEPQRKPYFTRLEQLVPGLTTNQNHDVLTSNILDPTHLALDEDLTVTIEVVTRHLCFKLHNHRAILTGLGSMNSRAIKRIKELRYKTPKDRNKPP